MMRRFIYTFIYLCSTYHICVSEKITYINVEHPRVTYYNPAYCKYANLTTTRYGRSNPIYYVGFDMETLISFGNNILFDFYFFELLTNVYKPSFIEFHYKFCDLLEKDLFFGAPLRSRLLVPCPIPPGTYNFHNMTINPAIIPKGFPFTKGRIILNTTHIKTKQLIGSGHIDMTISQIDKKKGNF